MHRIKVRGLRQQSGMPEGWRLWHGHDYGGALALWLNSSFQSEAQARAEISRAISEMNGLDVKYAFVRKAYEAWRAAPSDEKRADLDEAAEHVRPPGLFRLFGKVTARLVLAPDATHFDRWEMDWGYQREATSYYENAPIRVFGMDAHKATRCLLQLAERGLLGRMRECFNCRNWLYAKFERQRFCSGACREKKFRSSAEGKKKRREYMRDYRAGLKRMEENYLIVARRRER